MKKSIKLTRPDGNDIYFRPEAIIAWTAFENGCELILANGKVFQVKNDLPSLLECL